MKCFITSCARKASNVAFQMLRFEKVLENEMCYNVMYQKSRLNSEIIWKIQKKSKFISEKTWKLWKKAMLNYEKIWKIWKKIVK